jgi:hypothetical protein
MAGIGKALADSMRSRIASGIDANDQRAKPLKPGRMRKDGTYKRGYPESKTARGLQPLRDWTWTGRTLRSLQVLSVNQNRGIIGFVDAMGDQKAHYNNQIDRMFGISPKDAVALNQAVAAVFRTGNVIQFRKVA